MFFDSIPASNVPLVLGTILCLVGWPAHIESFLSTKAHRQQCLLSKILVVLYNIYLHPLSSYDGESRLHIVMIPFTHSPHSQVLGLEQPLHFQRYGRILEGLEMWTPNGFTIYTAQ